MEQSWEGTGYKDTTCREELLRDMIEQYLLEVFFRRLRGVVGDLLEGFVGWCKDYRTTSQDLSFLRKMRT